MPQRSAERLKKQGEVFKSKIIASGFFGLFVLIVAVGLTTNAFAPKAYEPTGSVTKANLRH